MTEDDEESLEELTTAEKYEKDIENYYCDIVNDLSPGNMQAFDWLSQGTYKLR